MNITFCLINDHHAIYMNLVRILFIDCVLFLWLSLLNQRVPAVIKKGIQLLPEPDVIRFSHTLTVVAAKAVVDVILAAVFLVVPIATAADVVASIVAKRTISPKVCSWSTTMQFTATLVTPISIGTTITSLMDKGSHLREKYMYFKIETCRGASFTIGRCSLLQFDATVIILTSPSPKGWISFTIPIHYTIGCWNHLSHLTWFLVEFIYFFSFF